MSSLTKFALIYSPETFAHFDAIERKHHRLIRKIIAEQLSHTPATKTRNRKPLWDNPLPLERRGNCVLALKIVIVYSTKSIHLRKKCGYWQSA